MRENEFGIPPIRCANKSEACAFFGVTEKVFNVWVHDGCPVVQRGARGVGWVVDLLAIAEWRYASMTEDGRIDPETLNPSERKQWYDGEAKRIELQVRSRQLVAVPELEELLGTSYSFTTQSLLSLPDLLERKAGLTPDQAEMAEVAIHEVLTTLADNLQEFVK